MFLPDVVVGVVFVIVDSVAMATAVSAGAAVVAAADAAVEQCRHPQAPLRMQAFHSASSAAGASTHAIAASASTQGVAAPHGVAPDVATSIAIATSSSRQGVATPPGLPADAATASLSPSRSLKRVASGELEHPHPSSKRAVPSSAPPSSPKPAQPAGTVILSEQIFLNFDFGPPPNFSAYELDIEIVKWETLRGNWPATVLLLDEVVFLQVDWERNYDAWIKAPAWSLEDSIVPVFRVRIRMVTNKIEFQTYDCEIVKDSPIILTRKMAYHEIVTFAQDHELTLPTMSEGM